ncbi:MAG TPA: hypothetical protein VGH62_01410 [Bradyrhizobium sp.]|jgi:hypothetical protein
MAEEDTMRLVAEVVDKYSGPLKDMQRSLRELSDVARGAHVSGAKHTKEHEKAYGELGERIERVKKGFESSFGPALATVGITAFSVGEAIKGVVESVQRLGESYNVLNDASKRSGLQIDAIRAITVAWERLGIAPERATESLARFGEFMDQTSRGASDARQRWELLGGAYQKLGESLKGLGREDAIKRVMEYLSTHDIPYDQKRKFFEQILSLPPELATKSAEEIREALEAGYKYVEEHPYSTKNAEKIDKAFSDLRLTIQGVQEDLANAFGPRLAGLIESAIGQIKAMTAGFIEADKVMHRIKEGKTDQPMTAAEAVFRGRAQSAGWRQQLSLQAVHDRVFGRRTLWDDILQSGRGAILAGRATSAIGAPALSLQGVHDSVYGREQKQNIFEGTLRALREWWSGETGGDASSGDTQGLGGPQGPGHGPMFRRGIGSGASLPAPGDGPSSAGHYNPEGGGAKFLAAKRAAFRRELDENPGTRELLGGVLSSENPGAGTAVIESLFNRTEMVNQKRAIKGLPPLSLRDMIVGHPSIGGGKSFYGPIRSGVIQQHLRRMRNDPRYRARMNALIDSALSGSNTIKGYTDQGSAGDPNYIKGGVGININRERFNDWGFPGSREWRLHRQHEFDAAEEAERKRGADTFGPGGPKPLELLKLGAQAGLLGGGQTVTGDASLSIDLNGFPRGTRTTMNYSGLFKEVRLNRGRPMAVASETA